MAIVSKEAVVNLDQLQTPSFKEKDFTQDWSIDVLYDIYDLMSHQDVETDTSKQYIVEQPSYSTTTRGITADSFVEKLPYLPDDAYYYDLSQDLDGYNKENLFKDWDNFVERNISNLEDTDSYEHNMSGLPLFTPYGAATTDSSRQNYLGTDEDLKQYWVQSDLLEIEDLPINIVSDSRGISIKNNTYTNDIFFCKPISITVAGYYCFSGYFRLFGNNTNTTKISGLHFVPETSSVSEYNTTSYETFTITSVNNRIYNSSNYFEVHTEWSEIALVSYLPAGNYNIIIYWPQIDNEGNVNKGSNSELRVAGLRIDNQQFPINFDYRNLSANREGKEFPIQFNFNSITPLLESDWTIFYRRYMRCNFDYATFTNQLGKINYGYNTNQIFIGGNYTTIDQDIYNRWGIDLITHDHTNKTLTFRTFGRGFDYTTNPYNYSSLITNDNEGPLTNTMFGVTYNLELGGYIGNDDLTDILYSLIIHTEEEMNSICYPDEWRDLVWPAEDYVGNHIPLYAGFFRDLIFLPRIITDEELGRVKKDLIGLSKVAGYNDTTEDVVTLRSSNLLESSFGDVE